eukprot:6864130-Pyramimonas_sp.AAC.2
MSRLKKKNDDEVAYLEHGLVDVALLGAKPARDGEGAGDVRGVAAPLRAGIHQHQLVPRQPAAATGGARQVARNRWRRVSGHARVRKGAQRNVEKCVRILTTGGWSVGRPTLSGGVPQ